MAFLLGLTTKQIYPRTPQDLEIPANLACLVGSMTKQIYPRTPQDLEIPANLACLVGSMTKQIYPRTPQDLEIPANLACLVGSMTPRSVYCWYTGRVDQILSESCLFDNAVSLLELGVERLVPLKLYLVVIKLIEAAVCRLDFKVCCDVCCDICCDLLLIFVFRFRLLQFSNMNQQ